MGLSLLANLSAYDFGYISAGQLIERTQNTFQTMERLERNRGHFYNWYDTQSLQPLLPVFISTVDSGNLAGHLLTLRPGLLALADEKILGTRFFEGARRIHRGSCWIALEERFRPNSLDSRAFCRPHRFAAQPHSPPRRLCLDPGRLGACAEKRLRLSDGPGSANGLVGSRSGPPMPRWPRF